MTRQRKNATRNDIFSPITNGQVTVTAMIQGRTGTVVAFGRVRTVYHDDDEAIDGLTYIFKAVAWLCDSGVEEIVLDYRGLQLDRDSSLRLDAMRQTLTSQQRVVRQLSPKPAEPAAPARSVTAAISRVNEVLQALQGTTVLLAHLVLTILSWSLYIWWRAKS